MKKKNVIHRKEVISKIIVLNELPSLKAQIKDVELEMDLLKETINIL